MFHNLFNDAGLDLTQNESNWIYNEDLSNESKRAKYRTATDLYIMKNNIRSNNKLIKSNENLAASNEVYTKSIVKLTAALVLVGVIQILLELFFR